MPRSVRSIKAAFEHARRLIKYAQQAKDDLHIVMRVHLASNEARERVFEMHRLAKAVVEVAPVAGNTEK